MSEYTTPISAAFEIQRNAVEQSQRAVERSIALQRDVNEAVAEGLDSTEESQRAAVEFTRRSTLASLDAVEAGTPGSTGAVDEVRRTVEEQFDQLLDVHADAFDTAETEFERSAESYDELLEAYLTAVEEQFDLLLEAHGDLEASTVETFDRTVEQVEELQTEMDEQAEEFRAQFESQAEEFEERFEAQLEQFREQVEALQSQIEETQPRPTEA